MAHDAFISYSHSADGELAPRVQDGLQRLAKPWWRRRSLHVFRDTTGLSANPGLWSSIESSMDDSDWFVFLASPESASSPWVERELAHWLDTRGPDQVLPVLTDGTWVWDDETGDFDLDASTAVPAALVGVFAEEPRHVDLSWARTEEQLDLRNGRFRDQVAELAAPMHGMAKDDLVGADVREHRRTLRAAWGAAAALLLLLAASIVGGVAAARNADEAASQRSAAEQRAVEADAARREADASARRAENERQSAEEAEDVAESERQAAAEAAEAEKQSAEAAERSAAEAEVAKDDAVAARDDAEVSARAEQVAAQLAELRAGEARDQARRANEQEQIATAEATRAEQEAEAAKKAQAEEAAAKRRETVQRRLAEERAREATKATAEAKLQTEEARRQRDAAERAKAAEEVARQEAETEALAAASRAQSGTDGALSLLLAVEASDRAGGGAGARRVGGPGTSVDEGADVTGRRALFEAVTAAQGGADAFRVDRYLPWPANVPDPPAYLNRPTVSADGRYLAAAEIADPARGLRGPAPARVFLWDLQAPTPTVKVLAGHRDAVSFLSFAGGGRTLVSQDAPFDPTLPPTVRIWDVASGAPRVERYALAYVSPTDDYIALQAYALPEVELVDAVSGASVDAIRGVLSIDPLGTFRSGRRPEESRQPFSPDGRYALIEGVAGATLWHLDSGAVVPLAGPSAWTTYAPRVSPDGQLVAVVENGTDLGLWGATPAGAPGGPYEYLGSIPDVGADLVGLTWSPDGTRLAALGWSGAAEDPALLMVLDVDDDAVDDSYGWLVSPGEVSFTQDGSLLVLTGLSYDDNGAAIYTSSVFDTGDGTFRGGHDGEVVAVDRAGRLYVERTDRTLAIIDRSGRTAEGDGRDVEVFSSTVSPSGRWLAVAGSAGVRVFDLAGAGASTGVAGPSSQIVNVAFRPGTEQLVGVGVGRVPVVWDLARRGAGAVAGAVPTDGTVLADGVTAFEHHAGRTAVRFRDLRTGVTRPGPALQGGDVVDYLVAPAETGPLVVNLQRGSSGAVVARPDGSVVGRTTGQVAVISRDGSRLVERGPGRTVRILRSSDLGLVRQISLDRLEPDDLNGVADTVALDPAGSLLAATNGTGTTVVWNVSTGDVVTTMAGRSVDRISFPLWGLAFSPDGRRLVVKSPSNDVRMYEVSRSSTWEVLATQQLAIEKAGRVVFSPDGELVMVDGLALLDGRTLDAITTLGSGPGAVTRFTADGRSLITIAGGDRTVEDTSRLVRRWSVSVDDLRAEACRIAGRDLTPDERTRYLGGRASVGCPG